MALTAEQSRHLNAAAAHINENENPDPDIVELFKHYSDLNKDSTEKPIPDRITAFLSQVNQSTGATPLAAMTIDQGLKAVGMDPIADRLSDPELMADPRYQPERVAGQTAATGLLTAIPQLAVSKSLAAVPQALQAKGVAAEVAKTVARAPIKAPVTEASALIGSATGAGYAEGEAPGSQLARLGGEFAGALAPGYVASKIGLLSQSFGGVKNLLSTYLPGGAEKSAGNTLVKLIQKYGENPKDIINNLRGYSGRRTAGQASKSPALLDLERQLMKESPEFGRTVKSKVEEELVDLNAAIEAARKTGDPRLIAKSAEIRAQHFNGLIERRAQRLESQLESLSRKMSGTASGRQQFSKNARSVISRARAQAKFDEKALWGRIDKDVQADPAPLLEKVRAVQEKYFLPPEEPASKTMMGAVNIIQAKAKDTVVVSPIIGANGKPLQIVVPGVNPTVKDLHKFYSRMRSAQRDASYGPKPDSQGATVYGELAEAAMTAIQRSPAGARGEVQDAINFTRNLHDRFSRGVIGKVLSKGPLGPNVSEGQTLENIVSGNTVKRGEAVGELIGDVAPIPGGMSPEGVGRSTEMAGEVENFILNLASKTRKPDGTVDANLLRKFGQENELTLDQIPGARDVISSTATAQDAIDKLKGSAIDIGKTVVGRLIGSENPTPVFRAALEGDRPITDLNMLLSTARRGGKEARIASGQIALEAHAKGGKTGAELKLRLDTPISPRGPRILDFLVARGAIGKQHAKNYQRLVDDLADFQRITKPGDDVPVDMGVKNRLLNVFGRLMGARAMAMTPTAQTSNLIAGTEGSKIGRDILENIPGFAVQKMLIELSEDPQKMALLISDTPTPPINGVSYANQLSKAKNEAIGILAKYTGLQYNTALGLSATRPATQDAASAANELYVTVRPEGEPRQKEDIRMRTAQ